MIPPRPARVWITRAEPGAARTAARIRDMGLTPLVAPLLAVQPLRPALPDLARFDALAFTSPNGVAAFSALTSMRDRPVFAVGDATAQAAQNAGFVAVRSAQGDLAALARLIATQMSGGALLVPQAEIPAGDLAVALTAAGGPPIAVHRPPGYRAPPTAQAAPDAFEAVLVHSPRAGELLADRHAARLAGVAVLCISPAAAAPLAAPLAAMGPAPLAAATPDEDALLAILKPALGKRGPSV